MDKTWIENGTVQFAYSELDKYLVKMGDSGLHNIKILPMPASEKEQLISGKIEDICDAYSYDIYNLEGIIYAINARSALLAVYQMLREAGCRFLRPGEENEWIPKKNLRHLSMKKSVCARYDHRGITIEGSVARENILDIIDWAPKVGYNSYFLQFKDSYEFFDRWYSHEINPFLTKENYTSQMHEETQKRIIEELKKRDLLLHAVGHGWTSSVIGVEPKGWYKNKLSDIDIEKQGMLAKLDGKRQLFKDTPLNTQLCYSKETVRAAMIDEIVSYAKDNQHIDYLHVWLADDFNNFCECGDCKEYMPADFYLMMLNELDDRLTKESLDIKIVFIIYYELLWLALKEKLKNNTRFTMMFAPIFRSYTTSYEDYKNEFSELEYDYNKIKYPREVPVYLTFLKKWREEFKGDGFTFEYYLMWDEFRDVGQMRLADVISKDIDSLSDLSLNGLLSCQVNRCGFPTGYPMYLMGHKLLLPDVTDEELATEYFTCSFGVDYKLVIDYLEKLSEYFSFEYHSDMKAADNDVINNLLQVEKYIDEFLKKASYIDVDKSPIVKKSWNILGIHASFYQGLAKLLLWKLQNEKVEFEELKNRWETLINSIFIKEKELQDSLDVFYLNLVTKEIVFRDYEEFLPEE